MKIIGRKLIIKFGDGVVCSIERLLDSEKLFDDLANPNIVTCLQEVLEYDGELLYRNLGPSAVQLHGRSLNDYDVRNMSWMTLEEAIAHTERERLHSISPSIRS